MVEIYEGPVRVFTADKAGNPYTIKNGKRAGQAYCRVSLVHNGETLYLPDFSNEAANLDGQVCKVAFSQRVDAFGEPDLYNGQVQWNLDAIKAVAGTQAVHSAPATSHSAPATSHSAPATSAQGTGSLKPDFDPNLSRRQTAANDATRLIAATAGAMSVSEQFDWWTRWAEHIDAWLSGKTLADAVEVAQEGLDPTYDDSDDPPF